MDFLSKNHTRQISIFVNNEYTIRKNKGIFIVSIFEIDIIKLPLFFLIFQLLVPKIDIRLFGQKFLKTATVLYCASARTDRQWPRNISLRSVNLPKKARADCSSSFQLRCALYVVEGLLSCQVHNRGGPLLHQAQWDDTRLFKYFLIVLENGLSMDRFLVT